MAKNLALRKDGSNKAVSSAPSFNWTPVGPAKVALSYPVLADLGDAVDCVEDVRLNGNPVFVLDQSTVPQCTGDSPGSDKGVRSDTVNGEVKPTQGSPTFKAHGKPVVRAGDTCDMQGGNTVGTFVAPPINPPPPPDGGKPSTDPPVELAPDESAMWLEEDDEEPPDPPVSQPAKPKTAYDTFMEAGEGLTVSEFDRERAVGEAKGLCNAAMESTDTGLSRLFPGLRGGGPLMPRFQLKNPAQKYGAEGAAGLPPGMALMALAKATWSLRKGPSEGKPGRPGKGGGQKDPTPGLEERLATAYASNKRRRKTRPRKDEGDVPPGAGTSGTPQGPDDGGHIFERFAAETGKPQREVDVFESALVGAEETSPAATLWPRNDRLGVGKQNDFFREQAKIRKEKELLGIKRKGLDSVGSKKLNRDGDGLKMLNSFKEENEREQWKPKIKWQRKLDEFKKRLATPKAKFRERIVEDASLSHVPSLDEIDISNTKRVLKELGAEEKKIEDLNEVIESATETLKQRQKLHRPPPIPRK